jgi:ABC-type transporter Mla subunit MlaD
MKQYHRVVAAVLCLCISFPAFSSAVHAAPPSVSMDEAVYVNLDHYGAPTHASIVKGCSLNGNTEFVDYGQYSAVTNMSNDAVPEMYGDGVRWSLPEGTGRFYFEAVPKSTDVALPWDFDISYKLNGVPAKAEELAGKSGLVEISVACTPNEQTQDYYKNNMLLQVASMFDMQDTLSVEAPGAQLQSLGTYKVAIFAAVPGEEVTFTMRVGTEHFESSGIIMMMIPGTLQQLEDIKHLKETKDTVKDSADAVYQSMNSILRVMGGMAGTLSTAQSGLSTLDSARAFLSSSKSDVYQSADKALSDLSVVSSQLLTLVPYLQSAQNLLNSLNGDFDDLVNTIDSVSSQLLSYRNSIRNIQTDVAKLQDLLHDVDATTADRKAVHKSLVQEVSSMKENLQSLRTSLRLMNRRLARVEGSTKDLEDKLEHFSTPTIPSVPSIGPLLPTFPDGGDDPAIDQANAVIRAINAAIDKALEPVGQSAQEAINKLRGTIADALRKINNGIDGTKDLLYDLARFMEATEDMLSTLDDICYSGDQLASSLQSSLDLMDTYFTLMENNTSTLDDFLAQMNLVGDTMKKTLSTGDALIQNVDALHRTMKSHKDSALACLDEVQTITQTLSGSIQSAAGFLTTLRTVLEESGTMLDDGTQQTLQGLMGILQTGIDNIHVPDEIIRANDTIKHSVKKEVDKFEDENKFLNIDPEQRLKSFTSSENPTPSSIQVLLRTEEISIDSGKDNVTDLEKKPEDIGVWGRIANVFIKIGKAAVSIFQDED